MDGRAEAADLLLTLAIIAVACGGPSELGPPRSPPASVAPEAPGTVGPPTLGASSPPSVAPTPASGAAGDGAWRHARIGAYSEYGGVEWHAPHLLDGTAFVFGMDWDQGEGGPAVWSSTDAEHWEEELLDAGGESYARGTNIARTPQGLVALGCEFPEGPCRPIAWSRDAEGLWRRSAVENGADISHLAEVVEWGGRLVIAGRACLSGAVARTQSGVALAGWKATSPRQEGGGSERIMCRSVTSIGVPFLWESEDGIHWVTAPLPGDTGTIARLAVDNDGRLFAAGEDDRHRAAVWQRDAPAAQWHRLDGSMGIGTVIAIVPTKAGLRAGVRERDGPGHHLWRYRGGTWIEDEPDADERIHELVLIAESGAQQVLVGETSVSGVDEYATGVSRPAVWIADGGGWSRVPVNAGMDNMSVVGSVAMEDQLVLVGMWSDVWVHPLPFER